MPSKFPQPSPSAGDADDERSNTSAETTESEEPTMPTRNIYTNTCKKYIPVEKAGGGVCGRVYLCIRTPSTTTSSTRDASEQSTGLVAIKIAHREMCRERIAQEIETLQRIQTLLAGAQCADLRIHFPTLLDLDSKPTSSGPRWLSTTPIRGFRLEQMINVVIRTLLPSSGHIEAPEGRFLAIPEVLILHIAQQLIRTVEWLHETAHMAHNDIFDANVMLDISRCAERGTGLPDVVLIDFDRVAADASDKEKAADRACVYAFLYSLARNGRAVPRRFMETVVVNKNPAPPSEALGFAEFRGRLGGEIERRIASITEEEKMEVQELIGWVVENMAELPGEEIQEVLRKYDDVKKKWVR